MIVQLAYFFVNHTRCEHPSAVDHGPRDGHVGEARTASRQRVGVENHKVGDVAGREPGASAGARGERDVQAIVLGVPGPAVGLGAVDGSAQGSAGIKRRDRRIRAESEPDARAVQRAVRECTVVPPDQ